MTRIVKQIITIESETGEKVSIPITIDPNNFTQDMKETVTQITESLGIAVFDSIEADQRKGEFRDKRLLRTEKRTYGFPEFTLTYARRSYAMPDGTVRKPLDEIIGFEKYQRRSLSAKEQNCAIATSLSYRKSTEIVSYMGQNTVSPTTIGRDVRELGQKMGNQELTFRAEEPGKIQVKVLYCESDGCVVPLQQADRKRLEIRIAIAYVDKELIAPDRRRLAHKLVLTSVGLKPQAWQEMIREKICAHFDIENCEIVWVGSDGGSWVGNTFDLLGVPETHKKLDDYHLIKKLRENFGGSINPGEIIYRIKKDGFSSVERELIDLITKGPKGKVKDRIECLEFFRNHDEAIVFGPSLGAIESNVDKFISQRMKTRGVSWSVEGATAMSVLLRYQKELFEHSFHYEENKKKRKEEKHKRRKIQETATVPQASFPILKNGKMSAPYAKMFKSISFLDLPL